MPDEKGVTRFAPTADQAQAAVPWILFAALLAWGWHAVDLFHAVPAYGDVLEVVWALAWYADALRSGASPFFYPLTFHPAGWSVATYSGLGPLNFLLSVPLYAIGGGAFAYNTATLFTFGLAFGGSLLLARRFLARSGATVAALLYTFWGFRWYSIIGQLNISLGSALLPWLLWSLEKGLSATRKAKVWCVLAGVFWAAAVNSSLYFTWIGGVVLLGWVLGHLAQPGMSRRATLINAAWILVAAGILSAPEVVAFWRTSAGAKAASFTVYDLNVLGASLNSLPIPGLAHPLLGSLARAVYHGPPDAEASLANLGSLAVAMAAIGIVATWRSREWRPVLAVAGLGTIFALGLTLKWDERMMQWNLMGPINQIVWRVGSTLKPQFFFSSPQPLGTFQQAIPLPALFVVAVTPFFEGARVLARYALPAGLAIFLLAGRGLAQLRSGLASAAMAILLIFEMLPSPAAGYAFPPPSHPAYEWLSQQSIAPQGIAQFATQDGAHLIIPGGGEILWATRQHRQRTISGAGSILPGHTAYLSRWLAEHPHPFQAADFTTILRFYEVKLLLLHMYGGWEEEALAEAQQNEGMQFDRCFQATSSAPGWDRPICVFELLPNPSPSFNLILREGWSGPESWGRWIDGREALASWVAMPSAVYRLTVTAFPFCAPGRWQTASIEVNGTAVASHQWNDCEPWSGQVIIPPELVGAGSNTVAIRANYALSPNEVTAGANPDPRSLSLGIRALVVEPERGKGENEQR